MRLPDFEALLREHRVDYVTRGPNVGRGELNVRCPFCGTADPSHHLGINPTSGHWSCWRNAQHKGKSPTRLLVALLGLPVRDVLELLGLDANAQPDPEGFSAMAARLRKGVASPPSGPLASRRLEFPDAARTIHPSGATTRFWDYLRGRGFDAEDVVPLCEQYGLMAATFGTWAHRILIPYYLDGALVTWTARAIAPATVRYKDLDYETSLVPPKQVLYNGDALTGGGRLVVVAEGPLDVLKLDYYGRAIGVRAVGLSTASMSSQQLHQLIANADRFDVVVVMADQSPTGLGAAAGAKLASQLRGPVRAPVVSRMPTPGRKDAGEMTPAEVQRWVTSTLESL